MRIQRYLWWRHWWFLLRIRQFRSGHSLKSLTYAETPCSTLDDALETISLHDDMLFIDLGCGQGKLCFHMAERYGMPSLGIDVLPHFIKVAQQAAVACEISHTHFVTQDMRAPGAIAAAVDAYHDHFPETFIREGLVYLAGTCLSDAALSQIAEQLVTLPFPCTILTTSSPLSHDRIQTLSETTHHFEWGEGQLVLQRTC